MENKPHHRLTLDMSGYSKLDTAQAGHLRHFHNLASQIDGEWRHMGTQEPGQEWLDAYRYQISSMVYGAGVAHYHRLPALRSVFKPLIRRLIHKMLRREMIAMRYNDVRDETNTSEIVLEKYKKAWAEKKMVAPNGLYVDWWFVEQDKTKSSTQIGYTAWANAFMNTWNSDLVKSLYDKQSLGFITVIDDQVRLHDPVVAGIYRDLMDDADNYSPHNASILAQAQRMAKSVAPTKFPYSQPTFGYVVQWLSEMGRTVELQGLLDFADTKLRPTWENGGLYYPRNDARVDDSGEWAHMDPFSGNAGIGYARLNVPDGQKKMWDRPWTRDILAVEPWIDNLDLSQGVDYLRGLWDGDEKALIVTMKSWNGDEVTVEPIARNLEQGTWVVYVNDEPVKCDAVGQLGSLSVTVTVGAEEVDVVFRRT
ncbi:Linalool dehydratase-isomerase [Fusarium sp. NRRL 25303]|nr:Linalool dehydratase-isomerase [Fusarium sp. NRRL 25303]